MKLSNLLICALLCYAVTGYSAERSVRLEGDTEVRLWVFHPRDSGDGPWPMAMLIPAGSGHDFIVKAQSWLGKELVDRGWVIAAPVSPDGASFFDEGLGDIEKIISELQQDPQIRPGKTLLVGISSGGSAALKIATDNPGQYFGVVAVPGRLKKSDPIPKLNGLPVFIRIADRDNFRWHKQLSDITRRLNDAGAVVDAALVPNARHIFKIDWNELDPWLDTLISPPPIALPEP